MARALVGIVLALAVCRASGSGAVVPLSAGGMGGADTDVTLDSVEWNGIAMVESLAEDSAQVSFIEMGEDESQAPAANATSNSSSASEAPPVVPKPTAPGTPDMQQKVMLALSAAQGQTKVREALANAKKAVLASKEAAATAIALAHTPSEKEAALAQVAVAKKINEQYREQYKLYNPFAAVNKESQTFSQMEQDVEQQHVAQEQQKVSEEYSAQIQKDEAEQKERDDNYQKTVAQHLEDVNKPPTLPTREPATYTKAQVDEMKANWKTDEESKLALQKKQLDTDWEAKKKTAVANAIQEEKDKAEIAIRSAKENAEKKVALSESKMRLVKQKAALKFEQQRLQNVKHAAASAALTAELTARQEAEQIASQADILAASSQTQADAVASAANYSAAVSSIVHNDGTNVTSATNGTSEPTTSQPALNESAVEEVMFSAVGGEPAGGEPTSMISEVEPTFNSLTKALKLKVKADAAKDYADGVHEKTVGEKEALRQTIPQKLLEQYEEAQGELHASEADERSAKMDSKGTLRLAPAAMLRLQTAHEQAVQISTRMKTDAEEAVSDANKGVEEAAGKTKEAMEKVSLKKVQAQNEADKAAAAAKADAAAAKAAAAAAAAKAAAKARIMKMQLEAAAATAMNIQNVTVQTQQDRVLEAQASMLRSMTNEQSSKEAAKAKTEADIDVLPPVR